MGSPRRLAGAAFALGLLGTVAATAPVAAAKPHTKAHVGAHTLTPAPPCPAQDTCVTIPGTSAASGGTVEVGPTENLGVNQWVFINTYGFTPGSSLHVNYCTNVAALPTAPLCLTKGTALISNTDYVVQTLADGTEALSYQVLEVDTTDPPLVGQDPGNGAIAGSFFCDAATPCSVDITNTGVGGTADPSALPGNTAVIPITFASSTSGCGSNAASVTTESEFGLEFVLPIASAASCSLSNPSIAFNTAADGVGAVAAVAAGSAQVAFTDDPEAATQAAVLQQGNYKLIPVGLTANVVAFKAVSFEDQVLFPLNSLNLTPTMVAGLLTGIYNTNADSDMVACPKTGGCPKPPCLTPPRGTKPTCSLLGMVNYQQGFAFPGGYEAFVRSDDAGSTGLLFSWLCGAPVTPVPVSVPGSTSTFTDTFTEPSTAASVIEAGFGGLDKPLTKCPITDQYPPEALGAQVTYTSYNDPNQQSIKMFGYVNPGGGGSNAVAAFSTMNWAEARYYGEAIAALQNADGQYVLPSATSLDAAVADATTNPDGSLTPNYATKDPNAYPMMSVVYAAVCADPVPTQQATNESDMLHQLLNVTGSSSTSTLPKGFVPLTSGLNQQAESDISADIVGGGSANSTGCPSLTGPAKTTTSSPANSGSSGGSAPIEPHTQAIIPPIPVTHTGPAGFNGLTGPKAPTTGTKAKGGFHAMLLSLASSASRTLLPLVLLLGLLALVVGGCMAASATLREQVLSMARSWRRRLGRKRTQLGSAGSSARSWVAKSASGVRRSW